MKHVFFILMMALGAASFAAPQGRNVDEVMETLRFIRLAETKKKLPFGEETLLKLNEILDKFEEQRFNLKSGERRTRWRVRDSNYSDKQAQSIIEEMIAIKKSNLENEVWLWERIQTILTPTQALEFFAFYEKFQRDVQKRIRRLQQERRGLNQRKKFQKRN